MHQPSSRNLSHEFKAYKELTLRELFVLVALSTVFMTPIFVGLGAIIGFPVAFGSIGCIAGFVVGICILPKPISRLKEGKPLGYLIKKIRMRFNPSTFLTHTGFWQKSKSLGRKDV